MTDPNNKYLFLAYTLVWIVFMLYAWSLSRRQAKLRRDLDEIKAKTLPGTPPAAPKA